MTHRWPRTGEDGYRTIAGCGTPDGNDRTERTCLKCSMVRITVHYPHGLEVGREWRTAAGEIWVGQATPPCLSESKPEAVS